MALSNGSNGEAALLASCPAGFLPDHDACIPFPRVGGTVGGLGLAQDDGENRDPSGLGTSVPWRVFEQIPLRPDRPASYGAYQYPVESSVLAVVRGHDSDRPGASLCAGGWSAGSGHSGVDLSVPRGTLVRVQQLPAQRGAAEVVYVGPLMGQTVVMVHTVDEAGRDRDYLVVHGHLGSVGDTVRLGERMAAGVVLGTVGDFGGEGHAGLHLEVRQVRDGVGPSRIRSASLVDPSVSIVTDPRNVLPVVETPSQPVDP